MKKIYFSILLFLITLSTIAQITMNGCTPVLSAQNYILTSTSTTNDAGNIRNTFESTPSDFSQGCAAGVCEVRIIWNISNSRWEIQLDNDGPIGAPDYSTAVLYYNINASLPNPPDLSLGTWVDAGGFCGGNNTLTLSGDVQSTTLGSTSFNIKNVKLFPNPTSNFIVISGLSKNLNYKIYNLLGIEVVEGLASNNEKISIKNFKNGVYFIKFDNGYLLKILKE
jgi:hypothetical protein